MIMNKAVFYNSIRNSLFGGRLKQLQVDNIENILFHFNLFRLRDLRWLAYILATTFHETASTMRPLREYGRGNGMTYGRKIKMNRQPYTYPDHIYYGRGYVQLTWYENYELMGKILRIPLLENPDLALKPDIAAKIMLEGMTLGVSSRGDFTGKSLEHYFNESKTDWYNARRIINGLDKAKEVSSYARKFYKALKLAS